MGSNFLKEHYFPFYKSFLKTILIVVWPVVLLSESYKAKSLKYSIISWLHTYGHHVAKEIIKTNIVKKPIEKWIMDNLNIENKLIIKMVLHNGCSLKFGTKPNFKIKCNNVIEKLSKVMYHVEHIMLCVSPFNFYLFLELFNLKMR